MGFYDSINYGLTFCENLKDFSDPFIFNGVTFKGFFDDTTMIENLGDGGFSEQLDASLLVHKSSFLNVVVPIDKIEKQLITVYNRVYRVEKVKDDRVSFTFFLTDTNR